MKSKQIDNSKRIDKIKKIIEDVRGKAIKNLTDFCRQYKLSNSLVADLRRRMQKHDGLWYLPPWQESGLIEDYIKMCERTAVNFHLHKEKPLKTLELFPKLSQESHESHRSISVTLVHDPIIENDVLIIKLKLSLPVVG